MKHKVELQALADAMPLMTWIANEKGETIYLNARWYDYTGKTDVNSEVVHPEDRDRVQKAWMDAVKNDTPFESEHRLINAQGRSRWFLVRAVKFIDKTDGAIRYYGTCTDIHEQKLAANAMLEASQAKDRFLATLSHELRTPLTPINSLIGVLREEPSMLAEDPSVLDIIQRNLDAELRLIDDLLDLSRIITGKFSMSMERVDLHDVLNETLLMVHHELTKNDLKLVKKYEAHNHYVHGDRQRLSQVFSNLLKNAAKFSVAGQTVTVSTVTKGHEVITTIEDQGVGIDPVYLSKIFEPFEQTEQGSMHRYQGLGLGLTIAKRIIDLHDGSISAHSEGKNTGASFSVTLRCAR